MFKKLLQWAILIIFLTANISVVYFAVSEHPFINFDLINLTQTYETANFELVAEGTLPNGSSKRIDLKPFFPSLRGEKSLHSAVAVLGNRKKYMLMRTAKSLFELENARGAGMQSVRLLWERWPKSKNGFMALHAPPDLSISTEIARFPQ